MKILPPVGFAAVLALGFAPTAVGQIKNLYWNQSSGASVQGQGRYFTPYPPGSAEGPGQWDPVQVGPVGDGFSKNTLPPQAWLYDHTLAAPNLNLFEWNGGVAPRVRHQFEIPKWVLTPVGNGQFNALEFKFVISGELTPAGVYGGGYSSITMAFETTERMKLVTNGAFLLRGNPGVPGPLVFDRNGYLYPGTYFMQLPQLAGATLELSLTMPPPDTDKDGISDEKELTEYHTDPTKSDTDGDGLSDEEEIFTTFTNALEPDTDGDGYFDNYERQAGMSPTDPLSHPAAVMTIRTAVELRIVTKLGSQYMIQSSADLVTWNDTGTVVTGTGGEVVSVFQPVEGAGKYWRVREM